MGIDQEIGVAVERRNEPTAKVEATKTLEYAENCNINNDEISWRSIKKPGSVAISLIHLVNRWR